MKREYTAMRDIPNSVALGMNATRSGKRFGRMEDAFRSSAAYWGECGQWYIAAAVNRDSDALDRSNFRTLVKRLGGESDGVRIERANHWACGWIDYLIIAPGNRAGLRIAIDAHSAYCAYPALDESDWSELEDEECRETWENCFDKRERAEYLRKHLNRFKGLFRSLRAAINGEWYAAADLLPCPSDLIC